MNLRIDSPGKSSAFVNGICISALSKGHEKLIKTTDVCCTGCGCVRLYRSVLKIKEKAYKIQRSTAKEGEAYPKKILLMNLLLQKMNPLASNLNRHSCLRNEQ